jgi:hypothetical protein
MSRLPLVAWDIETCPLPIYDLSPAQQHRLEKEMAYLASREPALSAEEASRKVRGLHPFLGWICCISAVAGTLDGEARAPRSWSCAEPSGEGELLRHFWSDVARFPPSTVWVTFNGKRFDAPFLLARTLHHHLRPTQSHLLDTYPYRHRPHADLACVWPRMCGLEDLCDLLGVLSPKGELRGDGVVGAVEAGRIAEVVRYCEGDVVATLACLRRMAPVMER